MNSVGFESPTGRRVHTVTTTIPSVGQAVLWDGNLYYVADVLAHLSETQIGDPKFPSLSVSYTVELSEKPVKGKTPLIVMACLTAALIACGAMVLTFIGGLL